MTLDHAFIFVEGHCFSRDSRHVLYANLQLLRERPHNLACSRLRVGIIADRQLINIMVGNLWWTRFGEVRRVCQMTSPT